MPPRRELALAVECADEAHRGWDVAQVGYLVPSARFAAVRSRRDSPRVALRDACGSGWRTVGAQAEAWAAHEGGETASPFKGSIEEVPLVLAERGPSGSPEAEGLKS